MKKIIITSGIIIALIICAFVFIKTAQSHTPAPAASVTVVSSQSANTFRYKGENGKDALSLLQTKAKVGLDKTGMVAMINGRTAVPGKKEYWAFYVNGKMAEVGPKSYNTKDTDTIEWKIEKF